MEWVKDILLEEGECITSYNINALFTSVPMEAAITIIKDTLEQDSDLHKGASMFIIHPIQVLP